MEKQYSVKFFASFLEALQKVCRDFVDFDDSVELSGYLSLEIDNVKKERYVLSEMLNSSGNVISESYCTKAFKTVRKYQQPPSGRENITPRTHTVTNRSQRDQHHGFMSESQNPNSSPLFNFKDHSSESRIPKQWGQDMYGQNSQMSPLHGSGHQYGDSGGIHTMKSSNQKRSVPTILIDDLPSNKRVRSDSLPDDKLLTETISPPVKVDTASAMQMSFSDTSQSVAHLSSTTTTSSSLISSHTNNYTSSNTSTSQANSESIRLPLPVTIKDEPDIPCVDIDLSELDSVDSMGGGSDSGSGYPSADGTSGTYRMGGNVQGTPESYQVPKGTIKAKRKSYKPETLMAAWKAVESGMTIYKASRYFGIPKQTLGDRKIGKVLNPENIGAGRQPMFGKDEEKKLAGHIAYLASIGYDYSRADVVKLSSNYAHFLGILPRHKTLSNGWITKLFCRWPELKLIRTIGSEIYHAKPATPEVIQSYFTELKTVMDQYNFHEKPQCIYRVDDFGINTEHNRGKVIVLKGSRPAVVTSSRSATVTVTACGNAVGTCVPPFMIFKGKDKPTGLSAKCTAGAEVRMSETGWSNSVLFMDFLENHFLKFALDGDSDHKLLLYDGHVSLINIGVIEWAREHKIILFVLPPNTDHLTQKNDCFGLFKRNLVTECTCCIRTNYQKRITKYDLGAIVCKVYSKALCTKKLKSSFKKIGICPFNEISIDNCHESAEESPDNMITDGNKKEDSTGNSTDISIKDSNANTFLQEQDPNGSNTDTFIQEQDSVGSNTDTFVQEHDPSGSDANISVQEQDANGSNIKTFVQEQNPNGCNADTFVLEMDLCCNDADIFVQEQNPTDSNTNTFVHEKDPWLL